ncbi:MAG: YkgJ family cysteine cluster protein [Thermogladius sp.]|jgi:hypothetical protein|nr:YkgJ family cysteine cluster protein [Thermogladius sp.]
MVLKPGDKVRFRCGRSGVCCSSGPNVSLTIFDICRIARFKGVSWRELAGRYIYVVVADYLPIPVLRGLDNKCVFLEFKGKLPTCSIYPARPMRCRLFPFIPVSPGDPGRLLVSSICPSVGRGPSIDPPWNLLKLYYEEVKESYRMLIRLIMEEGYEPVEALEKALDEVCEAGESWHWDLEALEKVW